MNFWVKTPNKQEQADGFFPIYCPLYYVLDLSKGVGSLLMPGMTSHWPKSNQSVLQFFRVKSLDSLGWFLVFKDPTIMLLEAFESQMESRYLTHIFIIRYWWRNCFHMFVIANYGSIPRGLHYKCYGIELYRSPLYVYFHLEPFPILGTDICIEVWHILNEQIASSCNGKRSQVMETNCIR